MNMNARNKLDKLLWLKNDYKLFLLIILYFLISHIYFFINLNRFFFNFLYK